MNDLSEIKRRIAVIKQTRQITGAMETISVAKMRKALERHDSYCDYLDILRSAVYGIAERYGAELGAYLKRNDDGKNIVVAISSDKGMCGGFNHDIFRVADGISDAHTTIIPVGQMSAERYKNSAAADLSFSSVVAEPNYENAKRIASAIFSAYRGDVCRVTLVYTRLVTRAVWQASSIQLLPLPLEMDGNVSGLGRMSVEPTPIEAFEKLLPIYLSAAVYDALLNSAAAEHSARRAAMAAATKNADETIERLSVEYNRARQSAVTEQITEIISSSHTFGKQGDTQ
ncbi:MAG: ATP synthase F1 subunit gamma [Roseburia sp.]|nr:ATP synthase F1 subunit gamma [Roseburia sp.]